MKRRAAIVVSAGCLTVALALGCLLPAPAPVLVAMYAVVGQKQGELYAQWVEGLRKKAKIVENEQVLSYEAGPGHEAFSPDDF